MASSSGGGDHGGISSARDIARASLTVGLGSVVSRATGLVRTVVVLGVLTDLTTLADAYSVANNMPNILYELLLGGVLTSALVPLFVERLDRQDHEGVGAVLSVAVSPWPGSPWPGWWLRRPSPPCSPARPRRARR